MATTNRPSTLSQRIGIAAAVVAAIACVVCIVMFSNRQPPLTARAAEPATQPSSAQAMPDRKLPELNLNHVPVKDAFEFLQSIATDVTFDVDWDALEDAGVKLDAPVTLKAKGKPLS